MRLSKKQLIELVQDYATSKGKQYGKDKGMIDLKDTDARMSPYNYRLVEYKTDGGAIDGITEALTARQMYDFLTK